MCSTKRSIMINILLSGNKKVFDGALTLLLSITNRTKEPIKCFIFTMDVSYIKPEYVPITDEQIAFLDRVIKEKNKQNSVVKYDVTDIYHKVFEYSKNKTPYCSPYTLLRLLADQVEGIPDKLLYLDIDMMCGNDLSQLYDIDIEGYEYAAVKEKYGCWLIRPDYINAGMLLLNMKLIRKTKLFEKARELLLKRHLTFADQSAVFLATTKKKLIPRRFNEQSRFNNKKTVLCHFAKRLMWLPYPHTENYKQWDVTHVHKVLKCYMFDDDLYEYIYLKKIFEKEQNNKK